MNAISLAVDQFVAVLTIHNPPANELSSRRLEELSSCLDQCVTDA
ncbi:enoyl-CoA hydratase, partial [Bacillus vallismortis]|nr:enoyl-CoA hydratase [Bacillus vallismortis]